MKSYSNSESRIKRRLDRKYVQELDADDIDPYVAALMNYWLKAMLARKGIESFYFEKEK